MNKNIKRNALTLLSFLVLMSAALSGKDKKNTKKDHAEKVLDLKAKNARKEKDPKKSLEKIESQEEVTKKNNETHERGEEISEKDRKQFGRMRKELARWTKKDLALKALCVSVKKISFALRK